MLLSSALTARLAKRGVAGMVVDDGVGEDALRAREAARFVVVDEDDRFGGEVAHVVDWV